MPIYRQKRNWSHYNRKLKNIASIEFFVSEEAMTNWYYKGVNKPGGQIIYSKHVIELALLMKEFYSLAYRQTQGFMESVFKYMGLDIKIPDYTTMSRRSSSAEIVIGNKNLLRKSKEAIVVAIDSTGLSLYSSTEWNRMKHGKKIEGYEKWRKLHVAVDVKTGEILSSDYSKLTDNDCCFLPSLLDSVEEDISALCADMAYDTINCTEAIKIRKARQLIPPKRNARLSKGNRNNTKKQREILHERDEAVNYS